MRLFDSHCHLDDNSYQADLNEVIKRSLDAGVTRMMTIGVTAEASKQAVYLADNHDGIYASVGIHPHDARQCDESVLGYLRYLAQHPKVCAWGEIGLDFNRMHSSKEDQEKWFIRQLEIGDDLGLPMIFHERDSDGRFLELLQALPNKKRSGVVHCFSGNADELAQYLSMGFHIGITGILTIKGRGKKLRRMAPDIPVEKILIETDAPYLVPAPQKNNTRRNEPAFVKSVLLKLAEVRADDPEKLAKVVFANTCRFYGIENIPETNGNDDIEPGIDPQ